MEKILTGCRRASRVCRCLGAANGTVESQRPGCLFSRGYAKVSAVGAATAASPASAPPSAAQKDFPSKSELKLNVMFWSKPCSLALPPNSPLRIEEPKYEGFRYLMLKMLLFYSQQSKSIRAANVIYQRILSQIDEPAIYDVFHLEKTFKTTFSLLVLHMWLFLRRLKEDGKEGTELGQYVYDIYNHDVELRVSKAGVNLLLTKWMKELEKIFYGNIVAYDNALSLDAKTDELQKVIWRNVFSEDGSEKVDDAALPVVQALARYTRRESTCLSLTEKEAIFSGNFLFTSLECQKSDVERTTSTRTWLISRSSGSIFLLLLSS